MAEEDRLGVPGILAEKDPVVETVSNVFRRNRGQGATASPRRGIVSRGTGRQRTSPIGAAFGNLAALGVAKLLGGNIRRSRDLALSEQRTQQKEARGERGLDIQEANVESLTRSRAAQRSQGAQRLGLRIDEQKAIQGRFETSEERQKKQFGITTELKMGQIAATAGVKFIGKQTGFEIPARVGATKFDDPKKARIKFAEDRLDVLTGSGFRIEPGSAQEQEVFRLQNIIAQEIESPERFGATEQAGQEFERNRQAGGFGGASENNNLGVR